jgi:hypothetical protein
MDQVPRGVTTAAPLCAIDGPRQSFQSKRGSKQIATDSCFAMNHTRDIPNTALKISFLLY